MKKSNLESNPLSRVLHPALTVLQLRCITSLLYKRKLFLEGQLAILVSSSFRSSSKEDEADLRNTIAIYQRCLTYLVAELDAAAPELAYRKDK